MRNINLNQTNQNSHDLTSKEDTETVIAFHVIFV